MGINYFKDIGEEKLAQILGKYPKQYDLQKRALEESSHLGFLNPEIDIESSLKKLNSANIIANKGRTFIFEYESGFLNKVGEAEEAMYQFYTLIENEMIENENNYRNFGFAKTLKRLKSKKITNAFTGMISEKGYFGLEGEWFDVFDDKDGNWLRQIDGFTIDRFRKKGIEVINLGVLEE